METKFQEESLGEVISTVRDLIARADEKLRQNPIIQE